MKSYLNLTKICYARVDNLKSFNMSLPKVKSKKLIKEKDFIKVAEKVKQSLEEEAQYVFEKKVKHGDKISRQPYSLS
jgi:hypothetical protein